MRVVSLLTIGCVAIATQALALDISGVITTQTWTAANSPYVVTDSVTVGAGETLTIEAGVDVVFDAEAPFLVEGSLFALGTETDSVRFTRGAAVSWRGLRISGGDSSYASYTRISDGYALGPVREDSCGGGLHLSGTNTRFFMENSVISGNRCGWSGAGVKATLEAKAWFANSRIVNNHSEHDGGGFYTNKLCEIVIENCDIEGNTAGDDGGGIDNSSGIITVTDSRFTNNWAYDDAGAIGNHAIDGVMNLTRCIIADNTCGVDGAGIRGTRDAVLTMTNCTVTGNESTTGGAIFTELGSTVDFTNSIVWGNSIPETFVAGGAITNSYSCLASTDLGTGSISADPLFVNADTGDFGLQLMSLCIDAGNPSSPFDPDGTRADMGALYFHQDDPITRVSGPITTQTWTAANAPYYVTDSVIVQAGHVLTIEAGVDIFFNAEAPFLVEGALRALGTETDSVRFLRGAAQSWRGLRISGGDSSYASYTRISDGYALGPVREDSCGGGLHLSGANTRFFMQNGVISGNTSTWSGAGVKGATSAKGWFTDCRIVDNNSQHDGGGLYVTQLAEMVLERCVIEGNSAGDDGGGFDNSEGIMTLTDCVIVDNWAYDDAGGVGNHGLNGVARLAGCVIADNVCGVDGGGVRNTGSALIVLKHCTIAGNTSTTGGGVYNEHSGKVSLLSSIVWANSAPEIDMEIGTISNAWTCLNWPTLGFGSINTDPLFTDPEAGDYTLLSTSPCIDGSDPGSPLDPDGTRADMGAFPFYQDPTGVAESTVPLAFALAQNAPNPFNPTTTIRFGLPASGPVSLVIYDINGRLVRTLVDGNRTAGMHEVVWDARDDAGRAIASGVYVYRLTNQREAMVRRMALVR